MYKLGPCCICETPIVLDKTTGSVPALVALDYRSPLPGRGWGCFVCGLSADGAQAVLCGPCADAHQRGELKLKFACRGYPAIDGRIPIDELTGCHQHDMSKHPEGICFGAEGPVVS